MRDREAERQTDTTSERERARERIEFPTRRRNSRLASPRIGLAGTVEGGMRGRDVGPKEDEDMRRARRMDEARHRRRRRRERQERREPSGVMKADPTGEDGYKAAALAAVVELGGRENDRRNSVFFFKPSPSTSSYRRVTSNFFLK